MTSLNVQWLPWQEKVWNHPSKHRVIVAGRRCGKTEYACYSMLIRALTDGKDAPDATRFYVAPTLDQAKRVFWKKLLSLGAPVIKKIHVNDATVTLINGQDIVLKGADRPETMRGPKVADVVLDEYADMKTYVWSEILEPATTDLEGTVTFIGSPQGRNHFYELYQSVELGDDPDWSSWHFTSYDNPMLNKALIDKKRDDPKTSSHAFRQEYMASFAARGSDVFKEEWVKFGKEPDGGAYYIAADLAGFEELGKKRSKKLDDSAIAIVKVGDYGWWVKDIICGRWTVEKTAEKIFNAVETYQPVSVGIERGIAKQAVMPPLSDMMRRRQRFFRVEELTHGNKNKTDRIAWALEGRFETGHVALNRGEWNIKFLDQLYQFPDHLTHDDMVDALAYIDQLATVSYHVDFEVDDFDFLDEAAGY